MHKLDMEKVQPASQRDRRAEAEAKALQGVKANGHERLKLGKTEQIIFRVTPEKRQQLVRLADALSVGQARKVSYTETLERALDALDASLKGRQKP